MGGSIKPIDVFFSIQFSFKDDDKRKLILQVFKEDIILKPEQLISLVSSFYVDIAYDSAPEPPLIMERNYDICLEEVIEKIAEAVEYYEVVKIESEYYSEVYLIKEGVENE